MAATQITVDLLSLASAPHVVVVAFFAAVVLVSVPARGDYGLHGTY